MHKYQQFTFIDANRFSKWFKLTITILAFKLRITILAFKFIKRITKNSSDDLSYITMKEVDTDRQISIRQAQFEDFNDNEITKWNFYYDEYE
ncbi:unnamed protein product [Dracunculus medinensis]|uniref:Uncharacterized protein n=1 Tax=Dracunculus medinensis TaxID=318479 RepID=A0A0N4UNU4_DRAME|nr:unnamed protein product [Dracunculus medinensis]VDN53295.1 unnamed protein product [Dracunculus medinensis]